MATSSCIKCGSYSFELKEATPKGSGFKMYFIQCSSCGGVVGVTPFHNTSALFDRLASKLGVKLFD